MRCSAVVDGPVNAELCIAFVEQVLAPQLRPGDVVVMDNLSSHKSPAIRRAIEAHKARLIYLLPYSPDLYPIEMVFSKIKQTLRGLALRTQDALWSSMQSAFSNASPHPMQPTASATAATFYMQIENALEYDPTPVGPVHPTLSVPIQGRTNTFAAVIVPLTDDRIEVNKRPRSW